MNGRADYGRIVRRVKQMLVMGQVDAEAGEANGGI